MIHWTQKTSVLLLLIFCYHADAEVQKDYIEKDYIAEMMKLPDETQRVEYVRSLSTNEIWILADQVRDKQGNWHSYGAGVILGFYFGENWGRITPRPDEFTRVIRDKKFNAEMRGALAASGFELGRRWKIEDRLQYFDWVVPLFDERDIPASEKTRIAEYSYRAFKRCLSEVQSLPDTNNTKPVLLDVCHTCAYSMMKVLAIMVESNQAKNAFTKTLEDYANTYEKTDFSKTPKL